jgi:transposase-like protein
MARPTKRTPDQRATLLRALRSGASYNMAARAAGMSPSLFRQWRSDDPTLAAEVEAAQRTAAEEWERASRAQLAKWEREAENMTWQDAARLLERHFPDVWGPLERRETRRNRGR